MNIKNNLLKVISVVLILCTFITILIIPVSAVDTSNANLQSFLFNFPIAKFATRNINSDGSKTIVSTDYSYLEQYVVDDTITRGIMVTPTVDTYFDLASFQSNIRTISVDKGDKITFNLSILSPYCKNMGLFIYFADGTRQFVSFERGSEKVFTKAGIVVDYSGESLSYGNSVYCHRYTLNHTFESTDGNDIIAIQIQIQYFLENKVNRSWIYYEDCTYFLDEAETSSDTGFFSVLSNIGNHIKDFFELVRNFFLDFGTKIKGSISPLFNSVGTWISNTATTTWDNFKTVLTNIKNSIIEMPYKINGKLSDLGQFIISPIKSLGESISEYFQNTFLGKVLRVTNKSKEFISNAGNDVQYAALDEETGESSAENSFNDWDLIHSSSFEIDIEYYSNLYPNVFETGG